MRLYVKHCPVSAPERHIFLEEHLKSRGFTDVVWITGYSKTHPFVMWLHNRLGNQLNLPAVSGLVKHYESLEHFVRDPTINEAIFCDDDAVFIKEWKDKLQIPIGIPFLNICVGTNFEILPDGKLRNLRNNGGCEAAWMTKDFARILLQNVDGRSASDQVTFGILISLDLPLLCSPVAQQTSILNPKTSTLNLTQTNWREFLTNFKRTGLVYSELWKEYGGPRD